MNRPYVNAKSSAVSACEGLMMLASSSLRLLTPTSDWQVRDR
ncbi:MAG: hypothetical protein WCP21_06985 [Armatimonadota bacterium]